MQILTRLNKIIAYSEQGYIPVGNSAICIASGECHNDALISTVDYVPTDIDQYEYHYIDGKFIKGDVRISAPTPEEILPEGTLTEVWKQSELLERFSAWGEVFKRGYIYQSKYLGTGHTIGLIKLEPVKTDADTETRFLVTDGFYVRTPSICYSSQILCSVRNGVKSWSFVHVMCDTSTFEIFDLPTDVDYNLICLNLVHSINGSSLPQKFIEEWSNEIGN